LSFVEKLERGPAKDGKRNAKRRIDLLGREGATSAALNVQEGDTQETRVMKRNLLRSGAGIALVAALICTSPASAGYHAKKRSCFWQAELVRPALTQPEKEAFIANCKANLTAHPRARRHYDY
jgi:hypothetical protein